jgi:hypothetical protein
MGQVAVWVMHLHGHFGLHGADVERPHIDEFMVGMQFTHVTI